MHTMHLLPSVAIQPILELKTWPKQLLGYLPLVIVLPAQSICIPVSDFELQTLTDLTGCPYFYANAKHFSFPFIFCWVTKRTISTDKKRLFVLNNGMDILIVQSVTIDRLT
jgi:hypothetical protein